MTSMASVTYYMHILSSGRGETPQYMAYNVYFTSQPPICMNWYARYAHDMHMICTWRTYMICMWHAHDMHMRCTDIHDMYMICSLLILTTNVGAMKIMGNSLRQSGFRLSWEGQLLQATAVYTVMLHCFVCIKPFRFCQLYVNSCALWFAICGCAFSP